MPLSFHQLYMKVLEEDAMGMPSPGGMEPPPPGGGMGGPPPAPGGMPPPPPGGGMGAPPSMAPPPPGGAPGADPNAPPKAVEIKSTNWIDFMKKALDKLEGKATDDDKDKQKPPDDQEQPPPEQPPQPPEGPPMNPDPSGALQGMPGPGGPPGGQGMPTPGM